MWLACLLVAGCQIAESEVQGHVEAAPAAPAEADAAPRAAESTVIVLSWDGTRWDYPDRVELPGLTRMARDGVRAERMIPVFPTSTFPNHVALATGAHTDVHGIVANVFEDPELGLFRYSKEAGFIAAEPLWIAAERQGVRSAVYFWVGSETDWHGARATYRVTPFNTLIKEQVKVDQILAWLDLPPDERPRLIMGWWHGADSTGHRYGPDDERIAKALREQDAQLERLLAGLDAREAWKHTTLIVVSDHGMAAAGRVLEAQPTLREHGIGARVRRGGGYAFVTLDDPERAADAVRVLDAIEGLHAYANDALPPGLRAHFPGRSGHVTLIPEAPAVLWKPRNGQQAAWVASRRALGASFGVHGFPADHPDMHAVFLALGRGVSPDLELGPVRAIDVAPTVSQLLGIEPPRDAEGRAIDGIAATATSAAVAAP